MITGATPAKNAANAAGALRNALTACNTLLMYTWNTLLHYPHCANAGCDLAGVAPVHLMMLQLLGVGIAVTGFWILVGKDKVVRDILDVFLDPAILMCIAGCIIFKLGFFGCLGALRENICLLKTVRF